MLTCTLLCHSDTAAALDTVVIPDTAVALLGTVVDPLGMAAADPDLAVSRLRLLVPLLAQIPSEYRVFLVYVLISVLILNYDASRLWNWFSAVDTDRSGHITVHELRECPAPRAREFRG